MIPKWSTSSAQKFQLQLQLKVQQRKVQLLSLQRVLVILVALHLLRKASEQHYKGMLLCAYYYTVCAESSVYMSRALGFCAALLVVLTATDTLHYLQYA
jgi:sterol desaturase/sphingolipid hydroxylase (fatty acid hydroxylase superfamily)